MATWPTLAASPRAWAQAPAADPAPAEGEPPARAQKPTNATQALDRAAAAYEFGDIQQMVDLSRLVAEGALRGDDDQRATALRMLGVGLYLSGRHDGAQQAFIELLKLRPRTRLDPSVTRPEVVAFFEDVKRQNRPKKRPVFALLPPLGQFQNGDDAKGWVVLGLEVATLATAVGTRVWLARNVNGDDGWQCKTGDVDNCLAVRRWNYISTGALAATWALGVIDALVRYHRPTDEGEGRVSFVVHPTGAAMRVSF